MLKGNKGEWSEIYALFKLLADKTLKLGNENVEIIKNAFYPIIKILRSESNGNFEYSIQDNIVVISGSNKTIKIPIQEFKTKSLTLLNAIKQSNETTFSIPEIEEFMRSINCISLKASSSAKTDINIIIHDQRTNQQPTLGFSIKSQLGNPSTLLNAGKTTNFIYKVENIELDENKIEKINTLDTHSKIKDRIQLIKDYGGRFKFISTEQQIFSNNLILIDSLLPDIVGEMIYDFYTSNRSKISDLISSIENLNPIEFDNSNKHKFYSYKIKRFLTDVALGMMPSKVWTGDYDATGGYLIVKKDGEILCYHVYDKNEFENYLINNTKMDTASTSRYQFGKLYIDKGNLYFKLNLQIRFLK
ncbi:HpaII family restriction endonuclease [Flavobacterium cerinum]|uniref:HpaII family restriction endonuclease n=1 Tax=Flavobacterium cerinum TaxID=2502784 RepID=A0A444H9N4_9FLAO|nr:HpaII family restriction endonuclease [Flavobacterium cerinum]RWW99949.1 HpaII family restriction endonuclease [Flavobacterium cerinum]